MKRQVLLVLACLLLAYAAVFGHSRHPLHLSSVSYEQDSVSGEFSVELIYFVKDSIAVGDSLAFGLPAGWTLTDLEDMSAGLYGPGDSISRSFTVTYPVDSLPFYPQTIHVQYPDSLSSTVAIPIKKQQIFGTKFGFKRNLF